MRGKVVEDHEPKLSVPEPVKTPAAPPRRRSRLSRWVRRLAFSTLVLCLLAVLALWVVTRSWFIVWQLGPVLAKKLGGDVSIARATYHGGGRVTFEDILLQTPELRGPAAEIAHIGKAAVRVDLTSLLSGNVRVNDAQLSGVTIRLSEDEARASHMNFMSLHPKTSGGASTPPPERVRIDDLTLEVGTHMGDQFTLNGRRRMAGEMRPVEGAEGWFGYELAEMDERGKALGTEGLFVKGKWNVQTTEVNSRIEAITLDERLHMMLPKQAQAWWDLMDLRGRVDGVMFDWGPEQPLTVHFSVNDIAMTVPVELGEVWSVYRNGAIEPTTSRPRMNVHSGSIRIGTDSLMLEELRGELVSADPVALPSNPPGVVPASSPAPMVGVPYEISLSVPKLPPFDWDRPENWLEGALKTSAFELTARMDGFSLAKTEGGEAQAVGLPSIVAKVLAKFQTTNWVLSTSVRVVRSEPKQDALGVAQAAPLQVTGQAYINDATGSYHKFPYKMEDVDAYLQFTNQRVNVEYLQARGSDGSTFRVTGYIEPPDKDAKFHLEVTGVNVPLDDRFRAALKPNELKAVDSMFNVASAERMARGRLLPDQAMLDEQAKERDAANAELTQLRRAPDADPAAVAALEQRITALERSIKAGPFVRGGTVDLQLTLDRPLGPSMPTTISGYIDVKNAGLIFDRFPYPLRGSGRLKWATDRVSIEPGPDGLGVRFVTPAGGAGSVTGSVAFPKTETGRKLHPDLTFVIDDDPVNPVIFAAIPYGKTELERAPQLAEEWPGRMLSKSGRIVQGIGLGGAYDYRGHIGTRADGKMDWDFLVMLDGGSAAPNALLSQSIGARAPPWPDGLVLGGLKGQVRVQRNGVSWDNITGLSGQTLVSASGSIDLRNQEQGSEGDTVSVRLDNAPIDRSALNMISQSNAARADELWDRFLPEGRMDAAIVWRSDAPPGQGGVLTLQPRDMSVALGGERVTLHVPADPGVGENAGAVATGKATIDGRSVRFENLAFDLSSQAAPDGGTISVDGSCTFAGPTSSFAVAGEWQGGRLESPMISEALRLFGPAKQADRYGEFGPAGTLDIAYQVARAGPDMPARYRIHLQPKDLEFTLRGTRLKMDISQGQAIITPGYIALDKLTGRAANGIFSIDGGVTTLGPLDASLKFNYTGLLRSDDVTAFLPKAVQQSLLALEFREAGGGDGPAGAAGVSRISNASLHVRQSGGGADGDALDAGWQTDFTGRIETHDASFVAGVKFTEVDGSLDLDVSHETGRPMRLSAIGRASHAVALGQELYDLEAPMTLNAAGDALEIPAAQARSGDGAVSASATSGIGARRDYQMRIDLVGVPLANMLRPTPIADDADAAANPGASAARPELTVQPLSPPPAPANARKPLTGQVYASLTLSGERGDDESKRGRGVLRVINGHLSAIPLVLQAIHVMQLTLPMAGELDYADAEFYVIGDIAHFEHILFESSVGRNAALQLLGEGWVDLRTMEIAARFRPRSGVAILRDIIGGIGDMLYEIELTGPLRDPKARIVPLP